LSPLHISGFPFDRFWAPALGRAIYFRLFLPTRVYLDETDFGWSESSKTIDVEGETCVEACPSSRGSAG
jgi:hypothetical protein